MNEITFSSHEVDNYISLMLIADRTDDTTAYFEGKIYDVLPEKLSDTTEAVFAHTYTTNSYDQWAYRVVDMVIEVYIKVEGTTWIATRYNAEAALNDRINHVLKGNKITGYEKFSLMLGRLPRQYPEEDGFFIISQPIRLTIRKNN